MGTYTASTFAGKAPSGATRLDIYQNIEELEKQFEISTQDRCLIPAPVQHIDDLESDGVGSTDAHTTSISSSEATHSPTGSSSAIPTAVWAGRSRLLIAASLCLMVMTLWGMHHTYAVFIAITGTNVNPMVYTWAASYALLWWVPLSWLERPATTTPRKQRKLDNSTLVVQIPVYNEDPAALKQCIQSVFEQTRLPQRIKVTDDGSTNHLELEPIKQYFIETSTKLGIEPTWVRTKNQGKRHAQVTVLNKDVDDSEFICTLDSDSVLERNAIEEGLKPFADPEVMSVAGMVVVWNYRKNFLTRLTAMLYTPFTRGFRSAQSVVGSVLVNSGTLAFYRGHVLRDFFGAYENETFMGRPMQMNDDSFMTFAALLKGKAVHQPNSICFTLVPDKFKHYWNQQLRWMRGTNVRSLWWFKYFPMTSIRFWMPIIEWVGFILSFFVAGFLLFADAFDGHRQDMFTTTVIIGVILSYTIALRYFIIKRSDESLLQSLIIFAMAPLASLWRIFFLRAMMMYALITFWKIGRWGTRAEIEVGT